MADYTTDRGFGGMWLLVAGVAVAVILLLVVFAGPGGSPTGTVVAPPDIAAPLADDAVPAVDGTAPVANE